ncbi:9799_t:CDS:2 [Dentiscutata erythropus]|uniref:9799_t:CDS:1 n=1 Tax=Dentiscutata erythropus TaxID=1348616 RepID=A0A9N9DIB2_9GLOM|nr:9799_t:CDS:2 [Dentiscutata erythropus]
MSTNINLGLTRIYSLLDLLDKPHQRLSVIHIAGTNGKGSVSAYIDQIIIKSGFKTARFNSPHLIEPHDSIRINGQPIQKDDYNKTYNLINSINSNNNIGASSFELLTATAIWWFDFQKVDLAIIEVGLGGRLDATNEKADIMKTDCKVVIAPQIEQAAENILKKSSMDLLDKPHFEFLLPLKGDFQLENAATAVLAIDLLRQTELKFSIITNDHIKDGIALLVDGAHNPSAAKALRNYVDKQLQLQNKEITKTCNVCWIFAATKGKDISKILELLMRNGDSLFAVSFTNVEGMPWVKCCDPQVILEYANSLESKINSKVVENLGEALRQTFASYDEQSRIVVLCGSLYLISDLFRMLQ